MDLVSEVVEKQVEDDWWDGVSESSSCKSGSYGGVSSADMWTNIRVHSRQGVQGNLHISIQFIVANIYCLRQVSCALHSDHIHSVLFKVRFHPPSSITK